ncbi:DNA-directed RNA polymerase subunit omega [Salibacterium halotolerans]|uniref:DNA-directed RNA polymerase subunit omega n=1 Tax=Salibacterium halotolerans TaxID=1884432 RepID=A0A1I5M8J5_9BACI|nr:DNA-directed RNA polymerase subunit omega [Salibacterium halotolerans]SFP05845.1 DNA-directed RNA polymerase subunit omega [Salibacterium halotolerans]
MLYPSVDTLMNHIDSKYTLCTISALRARELKEEQQDPEFTGKDYDSSKLVGAALQEIDEGTLGYKHKE